MVAAPIAVARYARPVRIAAVALRPAPMSAPEPSSDRPTAARPGAATRIPPPLTPSPGLHPNPRRAVCPPPRLPALRPGTRAGARGRGKADRRGKPGHGMTSEMIAIWCAMGMRIGAAALLGANETGGGKVRIAQEAASGWCDLPDAVACSIKARMLSTGHAVVLGESLTGSG